MAGLDKGVADEDEAVEDEEVDEVAAEELDCAAEDGGDGDCRVEVTIGTVVPLTGATQ